MLRSALFLGFVVDDNYKSALEKINPSLLHLFIGSGSGYLEEIYDNGQIYLGKYLENAIHIAAIALAKEHIISVLRKLLPDYAYENATLWLLPLIIK